MQDVADFLKAYPPFDAADGAEVDAIAAAAEVESHPAGSTIFSERAGRPSTRTSSCLGSQ